MTIGHTKSHGLAETDNHTSTSLSGLNTLISDANLATESLTMGATNSIIVKNGDNLKTIIDGITDSSPSNNYVVHVLAGIYTVSENITIPTSVTIQGYGDVIIRGTDNIGDIFSLTSNSFINHITIQDVLSGRAISKTTSGYNILTDISFVDCKDCLYINDASANVTVNNGRLTATDQSIETGYEILAGTATFNNIIVNGVSAIDNVIISDGANSKLLLNGFQSITNSNVGTCISLSNESDNIISNISITSADIGLDISDDNTNVSIISTIIKDCSTYNVRVSDACRVRISSINTVIANTLISAQSDLIGMAIDDYSGDEAIQVVGELHVGTPIRPTESCFGEGDSYVNGMLVYTYNESTSAYVDVSIAARSFIGSTFTFPDVTVDNALYFASMIPTNDGLDTVIHQGLKALIESSQVSGEIILEYYNGSMWQEFNGMTTDGNKPYYPQAKEYFNTSGDFQIRYDCDVVNDNWIKNDNPVIGTDYYWARARINSELITAPVFQQIKLHSSRMEINSDGWPEYFGNARPKGKLPINTSSMRAFEGSMASDIIWFDNDAGTFYTDTRFNSAGDKTGTIFELPVNTDTSCPLTIRFSCHPLATATYDFDVRLTKVSPGDTTYTADPGTPSSNLQTVNITPAATANVQLIVEVNFDISEFIARRDGGFADKVAISIATNVSDDIVLTDLVIEDVKWSSGGHI